uniref:Uncharacterized protein n=1 Tax=Prolemur simus TaxID=1328070 RepID=A0A8C8ZTX9_PROSS
MMAAPSPRRDSTGCLVARPSPTQPGRSLLQASRTRRLWVAAGVAGREEWRPPKRRGGPLGFGGPEKAALGTPARSPPRAVERRRSWSCYDRAVPTGRALLGPDNDGQRP